MRFTARLRAFLRFWYEFVIGDDWTVAAGVVVALVVTWAVSRASVPVWWLLPLAVCVLLPAGLWREVRRR
jgi:hypothetical protein